MPRPDKPDSGGKSERPLDAGEMPPQKPGEVNVRYRPSPPPGGDRKIHPRQTIPDVPEGEKVPDPTPSPPTKPD